MTMTQLDKIMREISRLYFVSLKTINEKSFMSDSDNDSPYLKYYNDVEKAFAKLDKEKRKLITKEYFYDDYNGWWVKEYRLGRFIRLKRNAIKAFMEAFNEIH